MKPKYLEEKFQCPHCHTVATQSWFNNYKASNITMEILRHVLLDYRKNIRDYIEEGISGFLVTAENKFKVLYLQYVPEGLGVGTCNSCNKFTLWVNESLIYPKSIPVAPPNEDMPALVKGLYFEASNILQNSPKGATALLRLALQYLMQELGEKGKNINEDIKSLVEKGLDPNVQMALDYCRVVGNNAVHPGEINLDDAPEIAEALFEMLNFIVEERISKPKKIKSMFDKLPQGALEAIEKRDNKT